MKTKVNQNSAVSFMDAAAAVNLAALTEKALMSLAAVVVVLLARVARACYSAARWCRYHFATLPRIYRLQLRAFYAVAGWMERHERATDFALVLMGVGIVLEVFFFAPID